MNTQVYAFQNMGLKYRYSQSVRKIVLEWYKSIPSTFPNCEKLSVVEGITQTNHFTRVLIFERYETIKDMMKEGVDPKRALEFVILTLSKYNKYHSLYHVGKLWEYENDSITSCLSPDFIEYDEDDHDEIPDHEFCMSKMYEELCS